MLKSRKEPAPDPYTEEAPEQQNIENITDITLDAELSAWLAENNYEALDTNFYLYKFEDPKGGSEKELVDKWTNSIPDIHDIGVKHGSGRYLTVLTIPSGKKQERQTINRRFKVGKYYDKLRLEELQKTDPQQVIRYQQQGTDNTDGAFKMIERVFGMVLPFITAKAPAQPAPIGTDSINNTFPLLNKMLMDQAERNLDMVDRYMQRLAIARSGTIEQEDINEETGEDTQKNLIQKLITEYLPLIQQIIPMLSKNTPQAALTAQAIKALPQVQQIAKDRKLLVGLIAELKKDPTLPQNSVDKALLKIGIKTQAVLPASAVPVKVTPAFSVIEKKSKKQ